MKELVETEEEFVTDMEHVVTVYYHQMDHPSTPRMVSDQRDSIFGPFKQIQEFHKRFCNLIKLIRFILTVKIFISSVLLEGLKYYANEPQRLGKTFLRLVSIAHFNSFVFKLETRNSSLISFIFLNVSIGTRL